MYLTDFLTLLLGPVTFVGCLRWLLTKFILNFQNFSYFFKLEIILAIKLSKTTVGITGKFLKTII